MKVPLLDLTAQFQSIKHDVFPVIHSICESQQFILGPHVETLESRLAEYCQSPHAVGVSSGTDALIIAMMAAGIDQGDKVITSPYTFFATAGSIARLGATPVFADIDPETFNLSPDRIQDVIAGMNPSERFRTKAIMPVHLYGQCAEMDAITNIAMSYGLMVIEDAAQAIGAEYQGRRAGSMGDYGCFSFFPSKNLGAFGDGGLVTARKIDNFETLVKLRVHGSSSKYFHSLIGGNFRLDALQATVVTIKLNHLDDWTCRRQENAGLYRTLFEQAGLIPRITLPVEKFGRHVYNQYIIRVPEHRDALQAFLKQKNVGCEIYYPVPLHQQACFRYLGYQSGDFPESEKAARETLALPVYPELTTEQITYVVEVISQFFREQASS